MTLSEILPYEVLARNERGKEELPFETEAYSAHDAVTQAEVYFKGFYPKVYIYEVRPKKKDPEIERYEFEGVRKGGLIGGGEAFFYYIEGDYGNPIIKEIPDGGPPWKVTFERVK